MASRVTGAARPRPGPSTEVLRIKTSTWRYFCALSPSIWGQAIHWHRGRSQECTLDKGNCEGCGNWWPKKWKGYLHVWDFDKSREAFLELTPTASELLEALIPEERALRGACFKISKTKGGAQGRYLLESFHREIDLEKLPQSRDPFTVLRMLWTWEKRSGQQAES